MKYHGLRHGENYLLPVAETTGKTQQHKTFIVGHSETGHHHVLESKTNFDVVMSDEDLYIRLFEPASLVHKKSHDIHKTLTVQPGFYKVIRKVEYDPWQQLLREVFD